MAPVPEHLQEVIERGEPLTEAQVRELIEAEARALGMKGEEAICRARAGTLPRHYIADDIALLVQLLPA